jgi:hypothetical protein
MATYIKGEKNFYPDIKPFTPDYKFLNATLDAREAKYQAGWQATNDLYSRMYSDLSREDTKDFQKHFIEKLAPEMQKISGLDLSIAKNVDAAKGVFAPFFEDDLVVKDMVYTSTYKQQMRYADQLAQSPIQKVREKYNPIATEAMNYRLQEFQNASAGQALGMRLPEFVEDPDIPTLGQEFLKDLGYKFEEYDRLQDTSGADGILGTKDDTPNKWIITEKGGKRVEIDAYNQIMSGLYDDPRVTKWYNTKAYVDSKRYATQASQDGSISEQQAMNEWAKEQVSKLDEFNKSKINNTKEEIKSINDVIVKWDNFSSNKGLTPAEQQNVEKEKSYAEQLQADLERRINAQKVVESPDIDDQALMSKAYSMLSNYYMDQDMRRAAYNFSNLQRSLKIKEDPFTIQDEKYKYELQKIRVKAWYDKELEDIKQEGKMDLAEYNRETDLIKLQAEGKIVGQDPLALVRGQGGFDYSSPFSSTFQLKDGKFVNVDPIRANNSAIAEKELQITSEKANLLGEMFSVRYDNPDNRYTIKLTKEDENGNKIQFDYTNTPEEITRELLKKKKIVEDGVVIETDVFLYHEDIVKLFNEQTKWFENRDKVYQEKTPEYLKPGGRYDKVYNQLFRQDPQDYEKSGLVLREDLFNKTVAQNAATFYDAGKNATVALQESDNTFNELIKQKYPLPYTEENGVKEFMSKQDYMKLFRKLAEEGKIKNFDPSGFNKASDGGDNPDWKRTVQEPTYSGGVGFPQASRSVTAWDYDAMDGKSSYIWDKIKEYIVKEQNIVPSKTFISLDRGLGSASTTDIGFVATKNVRTDNNPDPNKNPDGNELLAYSVKQQKISRSQGGLGTQVIMRPDDTSVIENLDISEGVEKTDTQKASEFLLNILQGAQSKTGEFSLTYFPNLGPQIFDDEGKEVRTPTAAYQYSDFSPELIKTLSKADNLPENIDLKAMKSVLSNGIMVVFDRNTDTNPGAYNNSRQSFIEQQIDLSPNQTYSYKGVGTLFSPGEITIFKTKPNEFNIKYSTNVFDPNSTDINRQYKSLGTESITVEKNDNEDWSQALNRVYFEGIKILDRQNVENNLMEMQSRAANLTEESWINEYMRKVPGATKEIAKLAYEQTMDNLKK